MILNWLKSLPRGFAFPSELQGLLRRPAYLWQVHCFAAQCILGRTCLVSGLARREALRVPLLPAHCWDREFCSSPCWIYNQKVIPAPSFVKRRIAAPWIFWALLTGGVTGNRNMLTLRHQMCEGLLQRLCFIYFILNMKIFHLNQTLDLHQLLD